MHHGIGSGPWVFDLKFLLVRLKSSKSIKNDGAKDIGRLWPELLIEYTLEFSASEDFSWPK